MPILAAMRPAWRVGALVAVGVFCGTPAAQELPRAEIRGVVRSLEGAPVVGARVEAWLRPSTGLETYEIEDSVVAKTDARGRFRVSVLDGYAYSVAASWRGREGQLAHAEVHEGVRAGRLLRLQESELRLGPSTVRVDYDARAPLYARGLSVRVELPGANPRILFEAAVARGVEQEFELPFVGPSRRVQVFVLSDDRVLQTQSFAVRSVPLALRFGLPVPTTVSVQVADDAGKPIPHARIEAQDAMRQLWSYAGKTDASGAASAVFVPSRSTRWTLRVSAPGYRETYCQRYASKFYAEGISTSKVPNPVRIVLVKATPLSGEFLGVDGKPVVGAKIHLARYVQLRTARASTRGLGTRSDFVRTDASGRFEFPSLGESTNVRLQTILSPSLLRPILSELDGFPVPETTLTLWSRSQRVREAEIDTVDLSKWTLRRVRVVLPDRRPARQAALVPLAEVSSNLKQALERVPRADRRGRLSWFGNAKSGDWLIVVEGYGWKLEPSTTFLLDADDPDPLEIELEPFTRRRVQVVDAKGAGVPGVRCSISGSSWRGSGPEIQCAARLNPIGLTGVSDENGFLEIWSIDRNQLTHQLSFRKGRQRVRVPILPDVGNDVWEVRLDG